MHGYSRLLELLTCSGDSLLAAIVRRQRSVFSESFEQHLLDISVKNRSVERSFDNNRMRLAVEGYGRDNCAALFSGRPQRSRSPCPNPTRTRASPECLCPIHPRKSAFEDQTRTGAIYAPPRLNHIRIVSPRAYQAFIACIPTSS
jgi:hypothetical protein